MCAVLHYSCQSCKPCPTFQFASGGVLGFAIYALSSDSFSISMLPAGLPDSLADVLFDHQGNTFQLPVIILAVISAAVLMVSFLGCVGSCQQSRCLVSMVSVS